MAHVVTLASSKGGSGKTTTALNLAVAFAERGARTLLADLDPQGAIGLALGRRDAEWIGLADHFARDEPLDRAIRQTKLDTLAILPRGQVDPAEVAGFEALFVDPQRFRTVVALMRPGHDVILLDTPSGLGTVTRAALAASDYVLLPMPAEPLALRSIEQVLRVIDHVQREENPGLRLLGLLPTMVQLADRASLNVLTAAWTGLAGVLETCVPRSAVFLRASELGLPVGFLAGRVPPEARRFDQLATEIEAIIARYEAEDGGDDERSQRELV